jgi:hypothetical protein
MKPLERLTERVTFRSGAATHVPCEVCLKEIPKSEASVPEAVDYFVYFCGPGCYDKWNHRGPAVEQVQNSGSSGRPGWKLPRRTTAAL